MRARDPFHQAQLRLQSAGCRYRIKQVARSPYVQVYDTRPPRRQQSARGYRSSDEQACWHLVEVLLQADKEADAGRPGLDWDRLAMGPVAGGPRPSSPTWGELRATVQTWIAPGGPKARDRNPFACFGDGGFAKTFDDDEVATTQHLEDFCLYTPASLLANREDPRQQLIERRYNGKGFYGAVQMVNYLASREVVIVSPELQHKLEQLKKGAGKLRAPRCKLYDLRHAWTLRAKATTTWSTAVKAASMGHIEAVHTRWYLMETAEHKLAHLLRRRDLDEGRTAESQVSATITRTVTRLPDGVTQDLIELARKLRAAGVG